MIKRATAILSLTIAFIIALSSLAGCANTSKNPSGTADGGKDNNVTASPGKEIDPGDFAEMTVYYGVEGKAIATIPQNSEATAVNGGIFYNSVKNMNDEDSMFTSEYHLIKGDGTDVLLGEIEYVGYESSYARTELQGSVYTTYIEGNPYDYINDSLYLLEFDLANKTIERYLISVDGYPYTTIAQVNGKILVTNYEQDAAFTNKLYEFDPAAKEVREVLSFTPTESGTGGMRGVCSLSDGFLLLRLAMGTGSGLYADRYDSNYNKVSEQLISDIIIDAAAEFLTPEDAAQEPSFIVFGLKVLNDRYLFYTNSSMSCVIIDLETGKVIASGGGEYQMSTGDGDPVIFLPQYQKEDKGKPFNVTGVKDGKAEAITFSGFDLRRLFSISIAKDGSRLLRLIESDGGQSLHLFAAD